MLGEICVQNRFRTILRENQEIRLPTLFMEPEWVVKLEVWISRTFLSGKSFRPIIAYVIWTEFFPGNHSSIQTVTYFPSRQNVFWSEAKRSHDFFCHLPFMIKQSNDEFGGENYLIFQWFKLYQANMMLRTFQSIFNMFILRFTRILMIEI